MIPFIVMLIAAQLAPGCRSLGSSVRCELAPPASITVALRDTPRRALPTQGPAASSHAPRIHRAEPARAAKRADPPVAIDEATMRRHIESLVSISDCTGAKTYATLIGRTDIADEAFKTCLGGGASLPPAPANAP